VDEAPVAHHQVTRWLLGSRTASSNEGQERLSPPQCRQCPAYSPHALKIKGHPPLLYSAASSPSVGGAARSISVEGRQPRTGEIMPNTPATNKAARSEDSDRNDVLNAIGAKWSKFSKQELTELRTNDELVTQIVAKYGVGKIAAQRDVDTLMNGRNLTA
jgi:hypothetical protein